MTMTDRVAAYLIAREGRWIDGLELSTVGGPYAWRSRGSDCRKRGHRNDNRQRRVGSRVVSEYRYCAPRAVHQEELPL